MGGSAERSPRSSPASSAAEVSGRRAAITSTAQRFTVTRQGGASGVSGGEPVRARVSDQQDALAAEMGRVVEAARVAIADRAMHARVDEHALPLAERRGQLAVDRELHEAHRGQPLRAQVRGLHVEEEPHAVRGPAHRLLGEAALEHDRALEAATGDVVVGQGRRRRAERAERGHAGQDQGQREPPPSRGGRQGGEQQRGAGAPAARARAA